MLQKLPPPGSLVRCPKGKTYEYHYTATKCAILPAETKSLAGMALLSAPGKRPSIESPRIVPVLEFLEKYSLVQPLAPKG